MRNKFPGVCYRCGKLVAVHAGHFEYIKAGNRQTEARWRTQHASCAIEWRNKKSPYQIEQEEKAKNSA